MYLILSQSRAKTVYKIILTSILIPRVKSRFRFLEFIVLALEIMNSKKSEVDLKNKDTDV